jgi:DNA polymerase-3 subunit epsilon
MVRIGMRASIDVCGCFPTGRHYPGIADRVAHLSTRVRGMARGFEADTVWVTAPLVVLDFETTGLDPELDRIIEIGVACFRDGRLEESRDWLVHPGIPISEQSRAITGITDEMVANAPRFEEVWSEFRPYLEGRIPVAYNHEFDSRFLWAECRRLGLPPRGLELPPACCDDVVWIDPLIWARELLENPESHKLADVCGRLGIPLETAHRASHDAVAAGRVLFELAPRMPQRYGELLRIQHRYGATQDVELGWRRR